jgi:hypothetical protein
MAIAEPKFFEKEQIESHRFGASAALAEQAVHCLELVASLAKAGLSFQFKGGNSLLLILNRPRRFSIDVDIATDEPKQRIDDVLNTIVNTGGPFILWTYRQHKTKPWIPLASYHLFYKSHFVKSEDAFIMLDAQLKRSPYPTTMKQVVCGAIYSSEVSAEIPFPASIIGDKLLTLGPRTLGIPTGKGKSAQRLKHVYDVSALLDMSPDLDMIRKSFFACLDHENSLQNKNISSDDVLKDTVEFLEYSAKSPAAPEIDSETPVILKEMIEGLSPFSGHLFDKGYSWQNLQRDCARAAACITAVCLPHVVSRQLLDACKNAIVPAGTRHEGILCVQEVCDIWNCITQWKLSV